MIRWRMTAILLVVLLALSGVAYIVTKEVPAETTPTPMPKPITFKPDTVTRVEVVRGDKRIVLTLEGQTWRITEPEASEADSSTVNTRLRSLINTPPSDAFASGGDLAQYGLDKPQARITFQAPDSTATLLVGDANPTSQGYYVQAQGDDQVYVVNKFTVDRILEWLDTPPYPPTPTPTPTETPVPSETPAASQTPAPLGTPTPAP